MQINLQPLFHLVHKTWRDQNSADRAEGHVITGWGVSCSVGDVSIGKVKNQANRYPSIKWVKATRKLSGTYLVKYNLYSQE